MKFSDPFLQRLSLSEKKNLDLVRSDWQMDDLDFSHLLDNWFNNFETRDKPLALKVLQNLHFYTAEKFTKRLTNLYQSISRHLNEINGSPKDIILLLPRKRGDSADRHSYDITKYWGITQERILPVDQLKKDNITSKTILVAFNDTHGSGNQFLLDIWAQLKSLDVQDVEGLTLIIVAITIAEKALNYFNYVINMDRIKIIPDQHEPSAVEIFTASEYNRLEELGSRVYPSHPMGYGNTGLLTAYYFQCPNNTLPIIWADGSNNSVKGGKSFPWFPLFPYKHKSKELTDQTIEDLKAVTSVFGSKHAFTEEELMLINEILLSWRCDEPSLRLHMQNLTKWFNNFEVRDRDLAFKIFSNIQYLSRSRVREHIGNLGDDVIGDLRSVGEDKSDILLVLTGNERPSVYHYAYDFLKIWNLKVHQVVTLEELKEHDALNKNLIHFYHTRADAKDFFRETVWEKIKDFPVRCHYIVSLALSNKTKNDLDKIKEEYTSQGRAKRFKYFYSPQLSKTVSSILTPDEIEAAKKICSFPTTDNLCNLEDSMLLAYYFLCPHTSCHLLWKDEDGWESLFKNRRHKALLELVK